MKNDATAHADIAMLQGLRAAACLLVVVYHTLQAAAGPGAIQAWPNGSAGVDLFFVISGYVVTLSAQRAARVPGGWRLFVTRRARRIVPLYWVLTLCKLALVLLVPAATPGSRPTAWSAIASLAFIPARDQLGQIRPVLPIGWSLNFEVFFYGLLAVALACRRSPLWILPVLMVAAMCGYARQPDWPAPFFLANGMALEFAAGMLLATFIRPGSWSVAPWLLAAGAVLLMVTGLAGPWRWLVWGVPAAAMVAGALGCEARWCRRVPRWLLATGDASFAIYLVHPFVVPLLAHGTGWMALNAVPASALAGLAVHRWVDMPLQARLAGPSCSGQHVGVIA